MRLPKIWFITCPLGDAVTTGWRVNGMLRINGIHAFRGVRFKVMLVYLLLILFAMELFGAYFIQSLNQYILRNYERTIAHEAEFLANVFSTPLGSFAGQGTAIRRFVRPFSEVAGSSVYILDKDGTVVGTSANPFLVGQKRVDPEVTGALLGLQSQEIALDPQTRSRQLYLAVPVKYKGQVVGAVEFVAPMEAVYRSISRIIILFATGTLFALGLTAVLAVIIARTITGPITAVTRRARALAGGDFNQTVEIYSNDEIGELASTFNMLTGRLRSAIASTEQEKSRLQAIMSTMSDGVIATNGSDDILLMNPAAAQLLHCTRSALGAKLATVLPGKFSEDQVHVVELEEHTVAVSVTALRERGQARGTKSGRVYVMRDVTEEIRLESARRRFVADVSHELRTPITTIKSYVEALLEGAMHDTSLTVRFLQVMDRETNRMTRLIRDLLQLSRLDAGYEVAHKAPVLVSELLSGLEERFSLMVFRAGIRFETLLRGAAKVWIDRDQIDQVLDNVVSNSLKHTSSNGHITVEASIDREREVAVLRLADDGQGIPATELPYIFDRFYRVDKARSRELGGTGLGLAIAREIIQRHDGEIYIESAEGIGTTVRIILPLALQDDTGEGVK